MPAEIRDPAIASGHGEAPVAGGGGRDGRDDSIRRITRELSVADPVRRRAAVYALARLMARDVASEVWRLADDPDADVRLALIDTAAILVGDAEPLLSYMATDPDPAVRAGAEKRRTKTGQRP